MVALSGVLMTAALLVLWRGLLWRGRRLPGVQRESPLLVGHRGVRGRLPENSMRAFSAALDAGLDGLETDVQRSRDGVLVLVHDLEVDGVPVSAWSRAQLDERVSELATLDELLGLVRRRPGVWLNLEIKAGGFRCGRLVAELILAVRGSALEDRIIVSSFNPLALACARLRAPWLRTAYLWSTRASAPRLLRSPWPAGWLHVDALHPHYRVVDATLVAWARRRELAVNVWTVNEAAEVRRLVELGVDGIMADDPTALLRAGRGGEL